MRLNSLTALYNIHNFVAQSNSPKRTDRPCRPALQMLQIFSSREPMLPFRFKIVVLYGLLA